MGQALCVWNKPSDLGGPAGGGPFYLEAGTVNDGSTF